MTCPWTQEIVDLADGQLTGLEGLRYHAAGCADCWAELVGQIRVAAKLSMLPASVGQPAKWDDVVTAAPAVMRLRCPGGWLYLVESSRSVIDGHIYWQAPVFVPYPSGPWYNGEIGHLGGINFVHTEPPPAKQTLRDKVSALVGRAVDYWTRNATEYAE